MELKRIGSGRAQRRRSSSISTVSSRPLRELERRLKATIGGGYVLPSGWAYMEFMYQLQQILSKETTHPIAVLFLSYGNTSPSPPFSSAPPYALATN
jgi:hypothetical protein